MCAYSNAIFREGLNNSLYYRESLDAKWVKMPNDAGKLKGVAVTKKGLILGIGEYPQSPSDSIQSIL